MFICYLIFTMSSLAMPIVCSHSDLLQNTPYLIESGACAVRSSGALGYIWSTRATG